LVRKDHAAPVRRMIPMPPAWFGRRSAAATPHLGGPPL